MEFVGLSNHRKQIRSEVAAYVERFRTMQIEALGPGCATTASTPTWIMIVTVGVVLVFVLIAAVAGASS